MSLDQISHLPPSQQEAFLNGPALKPPLGVIPNFENPPNRLATAYAGVTICLFATTVAVFVRFYFKVFAIKRVNIEDCKFHTLQSEPYILTAYRPGAHSSCMTTPYSNSGDQLIIDLRCIGAICCFCLLYFIYRDHI